MLANHKNRQNNNNLGIFRSSYLCVHYLQLQAAFARPDHNCGTAGEVWRLF